MPERKIDTELEIKATEKAHILMGKVAGVYGIKGWLKIQSYTRPIENISNYSPWLLSTTGNQDHSDTQEWQVSQCKRHGKGLIAQLIGSTDRDKAMELLNKDIYVYRDQLPELEEGEFYWHDIIGLRALSQDGSALGKVTDVLETGANDVLVIEGNERILVPWVEGIYVKEIKLKDGCISLDWPGTD